MMRGLLVGDGNTFIEKAYRAVTGESITKAKTDAQVSGTSESEDSLEAVLTPRTPLKEAGYNVVIYDAGQAPQTEGANRLVFGSLGGETTETLENVVLDMTDCDLTAGLSGFTIGVNTAYCFALPDGAKCFWSAMESVWATTGNLMTGKKLSSGLTYGSPIFRCAQSFRSFLRMP